MAHRWEWALPDGRRVAAELDEARGREVVFLGEGIAAAGPCGAAREGHVLDGAPDVVVTFEPPALVCILRVDGHEIAPSTWPGRDRPRTSSASGDRALTIPRGVVAAVAVVAILALVLALGGRAVSQVWGARTGDDARVMHRDPGGLFVARFPPAFRPKPTAGASALLLENREADVSVVVLALPLGDAARDPWAVQKKMLPEALATLPRADASFEETSRSDETCLGERGAAVVGRIASARGASAKVWSCALVHGQGMYLVAYALPEGAKVAREKELRAIVDATDLVELEVVAPAP